MERLEVSEAEMVDLDNQYWWKIKATSPNFGEDSVVPSNAQFKGDINPSREDRGAQYNVNQLPESLRSLCIRIVGIDDSDEIDQ